MRIYDTNSVSPLSLRLRQHLVWRTLGWRITQHRRHWPYNDEVKLPSSCLFTRDTTPGSTCQSLSRPSYVVDRPTGNLTLRKPTHPCRQGYQLLLWMVRSTLLVRTAHRGHPRFPVAYAISCELTGDHTSQRHKGLRGKGPTSCDIVLVKANIG